MAILTGNPFSHVVGSEFGPCNAASCRRVGRWRTVMFLCDEHARYPESAYR